MYDSIYLKITSTMVGGVDLLTHIPPLLSVCGEVHNNRKGMLVCEGGLGCYDVIVIESAALFKGSLCKWYLGNNLQDMSRRDTKQAIEKLSDVMKLPMCEGIITRLDAGQNLIMLHPAEAYFPYLSTLSRYKRGDVDKGSLYYQQRNKRLCLYDKIQEQKEKRGVIPSLYNGKNVLRVEARWYHKEIITKFGGNKIKSLYNSTYYARVRKEWYNMYQSINKVAMDMNFDIREITTSRGRQENGILRAIEKCGGLDNFFNTINWQLKEGRITPMQASRLRAVANDVISTSRNKQQETPLLKELNEKIEMAYRMID